jgi:tetratricopeptide (TPR) repeat protein
MLTSWEYKNKIIELQRNKDYREAYEALKMALAIYPTNLFFLSSEVYLLYRLNRIKEARQRAEERIDVLKNEAFFLKIYLTILERLKAKEDIEDFIERNILSRKMGSEDLYVFVSQLVARVFGKERALDAINRSLMFFQDSVKLRSLLDDLQKDDGSGSRYKYYSERFKGRKLDDVIKEIEGIRALPNYANDYDLLTYLAGLYKKQGDYARTIGLYKHLLTLKDSEFTRKMLGYAYYKSGDYEGALIYLRDFFLKDPFDHFLYSAIYRIFKEKRDSEGLHRLVNETLGINPSASHLYGLLARTRKWQKD